MRQALASGMHLCRVLCDGSTGCGRPRAPPSPAALRPCSRLAPAPLAAERMGLTAGCMLMPLQRHWIRHGAPGHCARQRGGAVLRCARLWGERGWRDPRPGGPWPGAAAVLRDVRAPALHLRGQCPACSTNRCAPPAPRPPRAPRRAVNQPEWCLVDAACHAYGMVAVPLYDTLGPDTGGFDLLCVGGCRCSSSGFGRLGRAAPRPGWPMRPLPHPAKPPLAACHRPKRACSHAADPCMSWPRPPTCPAHATLPLAVKYICNHAELAAVACSVAVLGRMLEALHECPTVRLLVSAARCAGLPAGRLAACLSIPTVRVSTALHSCKWGACGAPAGKACSAPDARPRRRLCTARGRTSGCPRQPTRPTAR